MASSLWLALFLTGLVAAEHLSEFGEDPAVRSRCTLNNGRCSYRIQLYDTCQNDGGAQAGIPFVGGGGNMAQLEQKLTDATSTLEKRMDALQRQMDDVNMLMLPNDDANSYWAQQRQRNSHGSAYWARSRASYAAVENRVEDQYMSYSGPNRPETGLLERVHTEFSAIRSDLEDALRRLAETESELDDKHMELVETKTECEEVEGELVVVRGRLAAAEADLEIVRIDLGTCSNNLADTEQKLSDTQEELEGVIAERNDLQVRLADELATNEQLTADLVECSDNLAAKTADLLAAYEDNARLRDEVAALNEAKDAMEAERDELKADLGAMNIKMDQTMAELEDSQAEVKKCKDDMVDAVHQAEVTTMAKATDLYAATHSYCGFEDPSLCGYTNVYYSDLDWRQWSGPTPGKYSGPICDHTCQNRRGMYMFVQSSATSRNLNARLKSPGHKSANPQCIEFYYYMYGRNVGILNVYLVVNGWSNQELPPPVWRAFGNQGAMWCMARIAVPVDNTREGFQIIFEARTEAGYEGDIALDDVRIFEGSCSGARSYDEMNGITAIDEMPAIEA